MLILIRITTYRPFVIILFFISNLCFSQNYQWLQSYRTKARDVISGVIAEKNGYSIFLLNYQIGKGNDTINFDSYTFSNFASNSSFLVRLDSNGKVAKANYIGTDFTALTGDGDGNYYLGGFGQEIAKFNNNFVFEWACKVSSIKGENLPKFSNGHLYILSQFADSSKIIEVSSKNGTIIWSNLLCKNKYKTILRNTGIVSLKNKLFISGWVSGPEGFLLGRDTIYSASAYILQTDTSGNYEKLSLFESRYTAVTSITTDGNFLYVAGRFKDTLKCRNFKLSPEYPSSADHDELFAASITFTLNPRWFFRPKILDKSDIFKRDANQLTNVVCSNNLLYMGGTFSSKILIDSNKLSSKPGSRDNLILKFDSVGNVLWATSGRSNGGITAMSALAGESVFASGLFYDSLILGRFSKYTNDGTGNFDAFITKITDYSITRGQVSSGPYCAGDTIKIPFSKFGIFDSTNRFVAQLSDENGNFDNPYELGRLKTNKEGTIIGKLPLFQVISSKKYRIRVISTSPKIQSYYRTDTLRLLIYSKDKANPGLPETICKGDTLKLSTFGGSKWNWSPNYNMSNSSARQPFVWPFKDTIYKIIIADSSGCGQPDTAFKKVYVKPYPKSNLQFSDTALCDNKLLKIPVNFSGGDSIYNWEWFFVNPDKSFFSLKKGNLKFTDTLIYSTSVDTTTSEKLAIILKDGCTNKSDTAFINIKLRKTVKIRNRFVDTAICSGRQFYCKATVQNGGKYQWKNLTNNSLLSITDSITITNPNTSKIQLVVNNGCENLSDTAAFTIKVKLPISTNSSLRDTTLCFNKDLRYFAKATGGDSTAYSYKWLLDNNLISTSSTFLLKTKDFLDAKGEEKKLTIIISDNCSIPNDTVTAKLNILPSPVANYTFDLACSRTTTKFQFTGTKPQTPITTVFNWNFNNEISSNLENPSMLFSGYGDKKIILTVSANNGCSDTLKNILNIKPQSKADFIVEDVCENDSAAFINTSQDASNFNWKFGDGNTSKTKSPQHLYRLSNQTITFNVTLVAFVENGCADSITKAVTVNTNPNSDFSYTKTGSKLELTAAQTNNSKYRWKFGSSDSVITNTTKYTHTLSKPEQNMVCLKVTNIAGCESQTCKDVTLSILVINAPQGFKLYPNPNSGKFTINLPDYNSTTSLEIYNQIGQLVYKNEFNKKTQTFDLNLPKGVYLLRLSNEAHTLMQKMIVKS